MTNNDTTNIVPFGKAPDNSYDLAAAAISDLVDNLRAQHVCRSCVAQALMDIGVMLAEEAGGADAAIEKMIGRRNRARARTIWRDFTRGKLQEIDDEPSEDFANRIPF